MNLKSTVNRPILFLLGIALLILPPAIRAQKENSSQQPKKERKVVDLDDALIELEKTDLQQTLEKALKEVHKAINKIDQVQIQREIESAMKEVQESIAKVNWEKIQQELNKEMSALDKEQLKREIENVLQKADMQNLQKEIRESLSQINMEEWKREMAAVHKKMEDLRPEIKKELERAKAEIENAKTELKEYKAFVDGLDNDGLLNKKEDYTIKHEKGELIVNGNKVPDAIYNKYRNFLEKHKSLHIKKEADNFSIDPKNQVQ